jgi:hypothetical protein
MLAQMGNEIRTVYDGEQALVASGDEGFDLDLVTPVGVRTLIKTLTEHSAMRRPWGGLKRCSAVPKVDRRGES